MEKKIESYLPLYLGQKVEYFDLFDNEYATGILTGIHNSGGHMSIFTEGISSGHDIDKCKLILRPLSSMTEEEGKELGWTDRMGWETRWEGNGRPHVLFTDDFLYLISKGFDIFGLKEKGLCLYPEEL